MLSIYTEGRFWTFYHVNEAVRTWPIILVELVDDQEPHTHQEGQGADHQQGHLKAIETPWWEQILATFTSEEQDVY